MPSISLDDKPYNTCDQEVIYKDKIDYTREIFSNTAKREKVYNDWYQFFPNGCCSVAAVNSNDINPEKREGKKLKGK